MVRKFERELAKMRGLEGQFEKRCDERKGGLLEAVRESIAEREAELTEEMQRSTSTVKRQLLAQQEEAVAAVEKAAAAQRRGSMTELQQQEAAVIAERSAAERRLAAREATYSIAYPSARS